jgi:hypothetical protein
LLEVRDTNVRLYSLDSALLGDTATGSLRIVPARADYIYKDTEAPVPTVVLMAQGVSLVVAGNRSSQPWQVAHFLEQVVMVV